MLVYLQLKKQNQLNELTNGASDWQLDVLKSQVVHH